MIGKTLGHYEVLELLGKGGMGEVYRARDTRLHREVALKVLPEQAAGDKGLRSRLEQEARAVAALQHPNIVTLFGVEEDQGRLFLAMELVRGTTLAETIGGGLEYGRLLDLAVQLCGAVGAAHGKEVVHRDLKPSNVMIDEDGRVKVLDFGLAKKVAVSGPTDATVMAQAMTIEGAIVGTFEYLSPEQAQGKPADARSDVFSLGIILYEMATGRRPFEGDNPVSMMSAIIKDEPTPSPTLRPELAGVIDRCLQKEPGRRYAGAAELRDDLVELKRRLDSGVMESPPRARSRAMRWAILPVLAVLAFLGWRFLHPGASTPPGPTAPSIANVVVVFPFENLGRPEDAYFAEGMTDEIASRLTSAPGIGVISRTTANSYPRKGKSLAQIGKDLGVNYVLEGTVRWDRSEGTDRVRVTPQLVRVADGRNAWSESYNRDLDDVFAIQSDIASQVAASIDVSLAAGRPAPPPPTTNLEAYDDFLRAKKYTHWGTGPTKSQLDRAETLLGDALALDPKFAPAWAQLSIVHSSAFIRFDPSERRLHLAEHAAEEAVRLQPDLAQGHLARGLYYFRKDRDYLRAIEELDTARRLEPGNGEILTWIGIVQKRQGKFQEALQTLGQAIRLDPRNSTTLGEMCVIYRVFRDFDEAMRWADRVVDVDPSLRSRIFRANVSLNLKGDTSPLREVLEAAPEAPGGAWARLLAMEHRFDDALAALDSAQVDSTLGTEVANRWLFRAQLHFMNGEPDEARAAAAKAVPILEDLVRRSWFSHSALALAYAFQGRSDEAVEQIALARESVANDALWSAALPEAAAEVYTVLGDVPVAVSLLEESLDTDGGTTLAAIEINPWWDPLRDSAEFRALVARHR